MPDAAGPAAAASAPSIGDQVRDDRVAELFADGATIVLQALHRTHAPVARLRRGLSADLGHPVQVNAYVTPPQSTGLLLALRRPRRVRPPAGRQKRWRIHAPSRRPAARRTLDRPPRRGRARGSRRAPALDVVLAPGDALYLPRGWLHAADALGDVSAHLTVGVHVADPGRARRGPGGASPRRRRAAHVAAARRRPQRPEPARAAPRGHRRGARRPAARRRPDAVARRLTRAVWPAPAPPPSRRSPRPQPRLRRSRAPSSGCGRACAPLVRERDGRPALVLPDRRVDVPAGHGAALARLLYGDPAPRRDLPGLDPDDAVGARAPPAAGGGRRTGRRTAGRTAHRPRAAPTPRWSAATRAGSAAPVTRWFLVEQPGPWGRDALRQSRLDPDGAGGRPQRAASPACACC